MKAADIVIYALGGGMGHLVRAASIARAIGRVDKVSPLVLAAPGFSHMFASEALHLEAIRESDNPDLFRNRVLERLREISPRLLVVDALPMGLMGELRDFFAGYEGRRVLIARRLRRDYLDMMNMDNFIGSNYDLVIKAEKIAGNAPSSCACVEVAPILARSSSEIPTRAEARKRLAVPRRRLLVMVVSTYPPLRADAFFQMIYRALMRVGEKRAVIKFASPYGDPDPSSAHTSYFPLMDLMPGVDVVVGHGGYHLTHETIALGIPFLAFPQERLYDDQETRLACYRQDGVVTVFRKPEEAEEGLRNILASPPGRRRARKFENGAEDAAQKILELYNSA